MREFIILGPFGVTRSRSGNEFSFALGKDCPAQDRESYGCYVYYIKNGNHLIPWYVGKTGRTFEKEIFTDHKNAKLSLLVGKHGELNVMFVVPKDIKPGAKPKKYILEIEKYLIQSCATINKDLLNIMHNKGRDWRIRGLTWWGKGNPSEPSKVLHTMLSGRTKYAL